MVVALATRVATQVQTEVPAVVAGAKPVRVEHVKVHGLALEGNLEGDAVDRDVFVFLPPSYARKRPGAILSICLARLLDRRAMEPQIHAPQTIEGVRSKRQRDDRRPS
jgi:hypothetical protein